MTRMSHHPPMTKKKTSKFRSKLEERVADLLQELGITYEYEHAQVPYIIQHHYTQGLQLNLASIRNLISLEMELPMVVLLSLLVYRLSQ